MEQKGEEETEMAVAVAEAAATKAAKSPDFFMVDDKQSDSKISGKAERRTLFFLDGKLKEKKEKF